MKIINRTMRKILAFPALLFIFTVAAAAQANTPTAQSSSDDYVTEKGFRSRVFDVWHRDPNSLAKVVRPLGSGLRGSTITPNSEFKTLTVRDFPENLTVIEQALKRLDTPAAARPNIDLHIHVLLASRTAESSPTETPAELKDVLTQLRETFNYKGFEMVTSISQRLTETERGLNNGGTARVTRTAGPGNMNINYGYGIGGVSLASTTSSATPTVQIDEFTFSANVNSANLAARVQTALNLRDGEKVVVGTAAFEDRALIVVLSAKLLK
ncbi:MAG TPA: hypothetical protein VNA17_08400 [Pyrinomonadaceae bacterium]|nr:hypothetical protein [Pyrinomonadaceae bacterium]